MDETAFLREHPGFKKCGIAIKLLTPKFRRLINETQIDRKNIRDEINVVKGKFGKNNLVKVAIEEIEYRLGL